MRWELRPELGEAGVEAALFAAVERLLADEAVESAWWRSGLDDLGRGPAPQQAWGDPGVVEP